MDVPWEKKILQKWFQLILNFFSLKHKYWMGSIERKMHKNLRKLLSLAKLIGACKYLDTESFSHKLEEKY